MKRQRGFSLMEMMIVLTIVAIVAAASAPMVNKKMVRDSIDTPPWRWTNGAGTSTMFNFRANDENSAIIGNSSVPKDLGNPRLYIDTSKNTNNTHIAFGTGGKNTMRLVAGGTQNNLWLSSAPFDLAFSNSLKNATILGYGAEAGGYGSVSIGNARSNGDGCVAIGDTAKAGDKITSSKVTTTANEDSDTGKIAIGKNSSAYRTDSIAIGHNALAKADVDSVEFNKMGRTISIGSDSVSTGSYSIAIGSAPDSDKKTTATNDYSIAIGTAAYTKGYCATAIGRAAKAYSQKGKNADGKSAAPVLPALAIGDAAKADAANSVAIGPGAKATKENEIVLGNANSVVHIPGKLVVDGDVLFKHYVFLYPITHENGSNTIDMLDTLAYIVAGDQNGKKELSGHWKSEQNLRYYNDLGTAKDWTSNYLSDRRLKNVGKEFKAGLDEIKKLQLFNYTFKDDKDKTPRVGVMAQDLKKVFPDAVVKGEDGFLRIRMEDMFYAVINAVKELDLRSTAQEKRIQELEKQNKELIKRLEALEK